MGPYGSEYFKKLLLLQMQIFFPIALTKLRWDFWNFEIEFLEKN